MFTELVAEWVFWHSMLKLVIHTLPDGTTSPEAVAWLSRLDAATHPAFRQSAAVGNSLDEDACKQRESLNSSRVSADAKTKQQTHTAGKAR